MKIFFSKINHKFVGFILLLVNFIFFNSSVLAFPIYAQQAYATPREANGRIACANCHLAQKPVEIEVPQSVLPNSIFEAVVKIPYDLNSKQILASGAKGGLNVGAVVILPDNFKLASPSQLSKEVKEKNKGVYISPYSSKLENILVVGPISGNQHQEISFPIVTPNPELNKEVNFLKYPIYVGANRGRGQINPTGEKTNNNVFTAPATGKIADIKLIEKNFEISITTSSGDVKTTLIPKEADLIVKANELVTADQPLTTNPNVGGFGQTEGEIVLQDPARIYGFVAFTISVILTQATFVFKKKQFEKVQIAELDF